MMSEPGKQIEIEDVLSSIRRLLSQDNSAAAPVKAVVRPVAKPEPASEPAAELAPEPEVAAAPESEGEADLLLLTPAQRIEPAPDAPLVLEAPLVVPEDLGEELSRLESSLAQMQAAVADKGGEFEPEEGDPFEADGDELAELVAGTGEAAPEPHFDEEQSDSLFADEMAIASSIDEDALRDLVTEIIRQELQGALGERITRNVRKLVRREIQRVLVSRDFE
ncbi:hypothetical protein OE699_13750 [Sedimentimonas flavescens]|uniref:DUF2497 domain-containing protein n=1 Tax=Sedimentimonas flavescens TaxID=2851012 RepID=A0ABT3A1V4_9RHOB|nr:hypothetical protein [Sedimentimonas flavescens]MCV2879910.1 hypothetical protein [Sedimentimonas flavescens]